MMVSNAEHSKSAETYFELIDYNERKKLSQLKIYIPTGRTHQIRVHLGSIGFPVLGDRKYGGQEAERVFLHAYQLTFPDPDKKSEECMVEAKIPENFMLQME